MSSNIRLLQLHSRLESLKTDTRVPEQLYAEKHSLLPLSPKPSLAVEEHPALPSQHKSPLFFSPKIKKIAGSIQSNTLAISAAAVFLFSLVLGNILLGNKPSSTAQAATSSINELKGGSQKSQQRSTLQEEYTKIAEKNNYGESLFKTLDISRPIIMKVNGSVITFGDGKDVVHESYSVLPGQKGNSLFVSRNQDIAQKLASLIPGSRVELQVGEGNKPELYKYIYIGNNQYPQGDANVFTSSQKSILNIIILNKPDVYNSFQFRLIGVDL